MQLSFSLVNMAIEWAIVTKFIKITMEFALAFLLTTVLLKCKFITNIFDYKNDDTYHFLSIFALSFVIVHLLEKLRVFICSKIKKSERQKQLKIDSLNIYDNLNEDEKRIIDHFIKYNEMQYTSFDWRSRELILSLHTRGLSSLKGDSNIIIFDSEIFKLIKDHKGDEIKKNYK